MVQMTIRPVLAEVPLNVRGTKGVSFAGLGFRVAGWVALENPEDTFVHGRVHGDMKRVRAALEQALPSAADYHAFSDLGGFEDKPVPEFSHGIGVERVRFNSRDGSLITAVPESFQHSVKPRVQDLITLPRHLGRNVRIFRDLRN